jgi:hypothetical protein
MKKVFWQVPILITFLLTACRQSTPVHVIDNATSTPSPIPTATPTRTALPSATPSASITPLPTIPTFTPTFDVSTIITVTPALKAKCPKENPKLLYNLNNIMNPSGNVNQQFIDHTLDFLNNGGTIRSIRTQLMNSDDSIRAEDLTVMELMN